ncbi:MAG: S9 family peptidase [Oscillospiraceae bacterium]
MKKVDYEHFGRFLCPHTLVSRGDELYFSVRRTDFDENKYKNDLYVLRGGKLTRLTACGDIRDYRLLGEGVVFPALREKKDRESAEKGVPLTVFQLLPYDGGEARELLRLPYSVTDTRFISATRFFFTANFSHAFEKALADCGDPVKAAERLGEDADYIVCDELPFRFNGQGYINKTRSRLYLCDNGAVTPITDEFSDCSLSALSGDGKRLYFTASRYTDLSPLANRLFELDTETLVISDISLGGEVRHFGAAPLPDGRVVVFASISEKYGMNENRKLYMRENGGFRLLYGGGEHCFLNSLGSDAKADRVSSDKAPAYRDGALFFLDTLDDSTRIVRVDLESGAVTSVPTARGNLTDAILFGDGFAVIALRDNGGGELYSVSAEGVETRLTELNTQLAEEYEYSAPIDLRFTGSAGCELHGWAIPPVGAEPGQKYPTILDIHGGPKTAYGDCYFHEMQLWASAGYAVIFCNPTGSDGRGDAFSDIRGAYGSRDFEDIMEFTDAAIARFDFIDPERMGVTGGSYGGFMTNWIIGHTDRFKAAASQRSIANWTSFANTSDIGWYFSADQTGGTPWDGLDKIWAQSPLKYADRVKTPTLFIHSEEDYRCPVSEGTQMFSALLAHGVPARICLFKGENHELSRSGKPKHRVRRLREISDWFDKYLKA